MAVIPTFAEFRQDPRTQRRVGNMDLTAQWVVYDELVYRMVKVLLANIVTDGLSVAGATDVLAADFLESWFGAQWVAERFGFTKQSEKAPDLWRALRIHRMRDLARRVYEFQTFEWFEHFIDYVRTNDVASALFEGDVLSALMVMPGNVVRNRETGVKGMDFDITAQLPPWELPIPVEVKAKSDDTPFAPSTVINSIRRAARQLPRGEVGWVFLRVPGSWIESIFGGVYSDALSMAVQHTSRIAAVFTALDMFRRGAEEHYVSFERRWVHFACPNAPDELMKASLDLHQFLAADMVEFAPRAPF